MKLFDYFADWCAAPQGKVPYMRFEAQTQTVMVGNMDIDIAQRRRIRCPKTCFMLPANPTIYDALHSRSISLEISQLQCGKEVAYDKLDSLAVAPVRRLVAIVDTLCQLIPSDAHYMKYLNSDDDGSFYISNVDDTAIDERVVAIVSVLFNIDIRSFTATDVMAATTDHMPNVDIDLVSTMGLEKVKNDSPTSESFKVTRSITNVGLNAIARGFIPRDHSITIEVDDADDDAEPLLHVSVGAHPLTVDGTRLTLTQSMRDTLSRARAADSYDANKQPSTK